MDKRAKPTIRIDYTGYSFWHTWTLVIPTKKGDQQTYYLGQDVKFISRVLGMDSTYFRNLVCGELGINNGALNMEHPKVKEAIAQVIVEELGGVKHILASNPWDYAGD